MSVGVLALQGDFREHREMLESMGHHAYEIRKPEQLRDLDALIIPGGESTTIARLILSNGFQQPLRDFCESGRPVWGTCAGAILLARNVDRLDRPGIETMDISVSRNAFGRQVDSFEADVDIKGLDGGPFRALFIRAPIINEVRHPAGAVGTLADGTVVAARQGNLLATSFHPELTHDPRLHAYFLGIGIGIRREGFDKPVPEGAIPALVPFIDRKGRLNAWPAKASLREAAIAFLATKFEQGRAYTESEVNAILEDAHTFRDYVLLRRMLFDLGHLDRVRDGSSYWRADGPVPASVEAAGA
jgi:5'-phosphate synthase pdxT subunit